MNEALDFSAVDAETAQLALGIGPEIELFNQANSFVHRTCVVQDAPVAQSPLDVVVAFDQAAAKAQGTGRDDVDISRQVIDVRTRADDVIVEIADDRPAFARRRPGQSESRSP